MRWVFQSQFHEFLAETYLPWIWWVYDFDLFCQPQFQHFHLSGHTFKSSNLIIMTCCVTFAHLVHFWSHVFDWMIDIFMIEAHNFMILAVFFLLVFSLICGSKIPLRLVNLDNSQSTRNFEVFHIKWNQNTNKLHVVNLQLNWISMKFPMNNKTRNNSEEKNTHVTKQTNRESTTSSSKEEI